MKVLLISANNLTTPYPVYPIGLDYVAGAIASRHEVSIADLNLLTDHESLGSVIDRAAPDIIGISMRNIDNTDTTDPKGFMNYYREIVGMVRSRSHAPIVLGGSGFTIFPEACMQTLQVDYGIIGEGERLTLLLEALEKQEDPGKVQGVITAGGSCKVPGPWNGNPSRMVDNNSGHTPFYLKNGGMLNLQTKRGCNFRCIYCTYPHIEGRRLRLIPPDEVAHTALALQAAGAKYIFITDSAFNADVAHSLAVAGALKKHGLAIPWGAFFAPTKPPDHYFEVMANAGMTHAEFGTESLSDQVLAAYQKPFRARHVLRAHEAATRAGLFVAHYFLLGGPGEDPVTLKNTLDRAEKLPKAVIFFFCGMRIYPQTTLYELTVKEGQIQKDQDLLIPTFYRSRGLEEDVILQELRKRGGKRSNWVIGSGGDTAAGVISKLFQRGFCGPLWEYLIR